jgi:hypothetical protein
MSKDMLSHDILGGTLMVQTCHSNQNPTHLLKITRIFAGQFEREEEIPAVSEVKRAIWLVGLLW